MVWICSHFVRRSGPALPHSREATSSLTANQLDGTSATNSEVQQLNIVAAEQEQGNSESRAQGQINACLVEQQVLANKVQRDTFAENLNFESQYQQFAASEGPQWGGAADALRSH